MKKFLLTLINTEIHKSMIICAWFIVNENTIGNDKQYRYFQYYFPQMMPHGLGKQHLCNTATLSGLKHACTYILNQWFPNLYHTHRRYLWKYTEVSTQKTWRGNRRKEGEGHRIFSLFQKISHNFGDQSCLRTTILDLTGWDVLEPLMCPSLMKTYILASLDA